MGYGKRDGTIQTFWPDDTENCFFLTERATMAEILDAVEAKWGDVNFEDINIEAHYIHTDCIGYDLYDPCDYTNFICVSRLTK